MQHDRIQATEIDFMWHITHTHSYIAYCICIRTYIHKGTHTFNRVYSIYTIKIKQALMSSGVEWQLLGGSG